MSALNAADAALGNRIDALGSDLQSAVSATNARIDKVEKKANAGIAAAMAMESAPYLAGKVTYAAGAAYHGGQGAMGVSLRRTSDSGRWSVTAGMAASSQGSPSVRIGLSGVLF